MNWVGGEVEDERDNGQTAIERAQANAVQPYETASVALAAAAKAGVSARFELALHRPRDIEDARVRLLKDCARPRFAEAARYCKPQGKQKNEETGQWEQVYVEGPSARFAEAALRHLGNLVVEAQTIFDDDHQRIMRVTATDLETNATTSGDVAVSKTLERRQLKRGQRPLRTRSNSYGDMLYIVEATDDEVANKAASAVSKMRRNLILQLVPADILEECMDACVVTQQKKDAEDPDAARRKVLDAFAAIGVQPSDLARYLGHDTSALNPAELTELRAIYAAIRDKETTWREVLETRTEEPEEEDKKAQQRHAQTEQLIAKQKAKQEAKAAEKAKPKRETEGKPPSKPAAGPPPIPEEFVREPGEEG
jgi:hypothetical protein